MGDLSKSPPSNFYSILGITKSASITDICKAYKSCVKKWNPDRHPSNKAEAEANLRSITEAYQALSIKKREETKSSYHDNEIKTPNKNKASSHHTHEDSHDAMDEEWHISKPTLLSRTSSRVMQSPNLTKSTSRGSMTLPPLDFFLSTYAMTSSGANTPTTPSTPVRDTSTDKPTNFASKPTHRKVATPIFYSQSVTRKKPPPTEKKLLCSLEELCHGGLKKIKITRDAFSSNGLIVKEEETLMINMKPGWRKGTKITFEGKGDERPGTLPADLIFAIEEKLHPVYEREGDDLELGVEVPLEQALTGCTVSVPLLGGGESTIFIDDIIYPDYERIIPGQGMPKSKDPSKRGDLKLKFLVEFPTDLSEEQRSEVVRILEEESYFDFPLSEKLRFTG